MLIIPHYKFIKMISIFKPLGMALLLIFLLASCGPNPKTEDVAQSAKTNQKSIPVGEISKADQIIREAIVRHGGEALKKARVDFDFRNRHYSGKGIGANFEYERIFKDSSGAEVLDKLTNDAFKRFIDGKETPISSKDSAAYSNSVNSVLYFALLPFFLEDPAVHSTYLGTAQLEGGTYDKIKVVFSEEDGGKDFEDEFVYWVHQEEKTMDFLAYNYLTDGGGARFRKAYNIREIKGVRFADYINFKPMIPSRAVAQFDSLFEVGGMKELSRIELEHIKVAR